MIFIISLILIIYGILSFFVIKNNFLENFSKKVWTNIILWCIIPNIGRGDIIYLLDLFFIVLIFNFFIVLCFIYSLFQRVILHNIQGAKLKLKLKSETDL